MLAYRVELVAKLSGSQYEPAQQLAQGCGGRTKNGAGECMRACVIM